MGAWGLNTRRRNGHKSSVGRDKGGEDDEFFVDDEFDCDEKAIDRLVDAVADQLHRIAAPGDKSLVTRPPKHTHACMHCAAPDSAPVSILRHHKRRGLDLAHTAVFKRLDLV